jgi:L-lactate utilization protein LutC
VNATIENLRQYVRAYSEIMLEIRHMHKLDRVCQFVMGLPTWAKQKLEENWPSSLSEAITKVEGFSDVGRSEKSGFKKDNKFLHKKPKHDDEWNREQGMTRSQVGLTHSSCGISRTRGTLLASSTKGGEKDVLKVPG